MTTYPQNTTVLVVDDSPVQLELISQILAEARFRIYTASNGPKALEILKQHPADVIILDIVMPEMDGFEICSQIKMNPQTSEIPVIFLSSLSGTRDVVKGLAIGGADFIIKPYSPEEMIERVKIHARQKKEKDLVNMKIEELRKANRLLMGTVHKMSHFFHHE